MPTIADVVGELPPEQQPAEAVESEAVEERGGIDLSFLRAPTGPGNISEYVDHPLNFGRSQGLAQVLRGATGFAGDLKLAIIDVLLGAIHWMKERKRDADTTGQ